MDVIKMEPAVDPLDLQIHDSIYEMDENDLLSQQRNLSHLEMTAMKTESVDQSYDIKSEIKVEDDSPETIGFHMVKSEVEEDMFDVDKVKQEQKVEVSSEEDEVLTERIAATSDRIVSSKFDGIAYEENEPVYQISKNPGFSERPAWTHEDEKQLESEIGEKPFRCAVCGKCFSDSGHMKRHERLRHKRQTFQMQSLREQCVVFDAPQKL
ncbi:uncharacterized protein [Periplaneta americana]|uniref:uncharacterized protein n=1 Tax=Periplaneta americana TaxID=6978 RepID=UPI0037E7C2A4